MASAFAIASILLVSVLQKSKQIGILKSMGAHRRQISEPSSAEQLFPVAILPLSIGLAMLSATLATVLAALLPARRAASLNPVEVIR